VTVSYFTISARSGGEEAPTGFLPMIFTITRPRKRLRRGKLAAKKPLATQERNERREVQGFQP